MPLFTRQPGKLWSLLARQPGEYWSYWAGSLVDISPQENSLHIKFADSCFVLLNVTCSPYGINVWTSSPRFGQADHLLLPHKPSQPLSDKVIECTDCEKERFHAKCSNLGADDLSKIETGNSDWYCTNCKADCGGAVLSGYKAVQCDGCEMWIHNECPFITEAEYENVLKSGCTWIYPKCEFFNFSDSFFVDQLNLINRNRFDPLTKEKKK